MHGSTIKSTSRQAKRDLEERLGKPVDAFSWVGGQSDDFRSRAAATIIRRAGYRLSFMTNSYPIMPHCNLHQLQRTRLEANWDPSLVSVSAFGGSLTLPIAAIATRSTNERMSEPVSS